MWKASLRVGDLELPVRLYAGVENRAVRFRLLHARDHVPVVQRMVDPETRDVVAPEEVRRGLQLEPGVFVVLRPEELAADAPAPSRTIEVTRFVPRQSIDLAWYARPYLLGPDGRPGEYFALARALADSGRFGVARWVMRGRRHAGALVPRQGRLALVALQPVELVVAAEQLVRTEAPAVSSRERALAGQLLAALDAPFDAAALRDDHRERVRELVAAKAEGRTIELKQDRTPKPTSDLTQALRESLRAAREMRVA